MKKHLRLSICLILCITVVLNSRLYNNKVEAATIKLNKTKITLDLGMSYTLKVSGTTKTVKWTSSDKKIVDVTNKGKITALAEGTATITASVSSKKLTCKVTVTDKLTSNWKDFALIINDKFYKLPFDFKQLQNDGWDFNLADYGLDSKFSLEPGTRFATIFKLEHKEFDSDIYIGFKNTTSKEREIMKCKVNSICISNKFAKNPVSVTLPGGIRFGSSALDVLEAYDDPDISNKNLNLDTWIYSYLGKNDYIVLEFMIDDYVGVYDFLYVNLE